MTKEEKKQWLEERRTGIGGSDVAAVLGINPYRSPVEVYLDKTGQSPLETPDNDKMYWGRALEDLVAQEFSKRTGKKVQRRNQMFRDKEYSFLIANIDRYIVGEQAILECKTASEYTKDQWGEDGTDDVPFYYLCQVLHYMYVTGYYKGYLAVLIGGYDYRIYNISYNENVANKIKSKCIDFWNNHVLKKVPPKPINLEDVKALYSTTSQEAIIKEADENILQLTETYKALKQEEKDILEKLKETQKKIMEFLQDANTLINPVSGKILATWKENKTKRFDASILKIEQPEIYNKYTKEISSRRFIIKK